MSGYKRVNFYELCRLCASNQQKEKTHIFHEEGRKIQLQTKIQSLLSLKVCEDDCLPKVVCSKCLQCLEDCFSFRNECVTSESMLSSYFNTYRYKEDFTKTGKVYIKDTQPTPKFELMYTKDEARIEPEITASSHNEPDITPSYTQQEVKMKNPQVFVNVKPQSQHTPRSQPEAFTINANGELVTFTPLIDLEGLVQPPPQIQQPPKKQRTSLLKKLKQEPENTNNEEGIISYNLSDKNSSQKSKEKVFPIKVEVEAKSVNLSSQIIVNPVPIRNITLPLGNANTSQAFQTQKIIENFNACIYTNQVDYPQVEQNLDAGQPITALNTISSNWTDNISIPQENILHKKNQSPEGGSKIFECDICKKTFKRREHLYQHVKLHTGFRPFGCEHCKKAFMRKEHLLRHMTSHSGLKNFTCNICDKSFSRNDNLLKHKKTHEKESNFICEICNKHFVMKHYYVAHKLTHDMENKCNNESNVAWSIKA